MRRTTILVFSPASPPSTFTTVCVDCSAAFGAWAAKRFPLNVADAPAASAGLAAPAAPAMLPSRRSAMAARAGAPSDRSTRLRPHRVCRPGRLLDSLFMATSGQERHVEGQSGSPPSERTRILFLVEGEQEESRPALRQPSAFRPDAATRPDEDECSCRGTERALSVGVGRTPPSQRGSSGGVQQMADRASSGASTVALISRIVGDANCTKPRNLAG